MSNLKPLVWKESSKDGFVEHTAQGAGVFYRIFRSNEDIKVIWVDSMGGSDGSKSFRFLDEAKNWIETERYAQNMQPYVVPEFISIDEQLPEQNTNVLVLYHAHFENEEITEFDICTAFFRNESFDVKDQNFYTRRKIKVVGWKAIDAVAAFKKMKKRVSKQGE